jgi:leader peptidase (prepilin peptidase)/N-methyltransferase
MEFLISVFIFIFGSIVGSFLNSVIYRLSKKESFLIKRSYCPHCSHTLQWQDLIPFFSFLILKGRCRYCKKRISLQYPLVEFATGFLFAFIFFQNVPFLFSGSIIFNLLNICFLFLVSCFLIIIFVYDLYHFIIPDNIIYPAILAAGFWRLASDILLNINTREEILNTIYSALGAAAFFLAIVLLSRGKGMGVGDVKLAFFMGLILGFPDILTALFLSFFLGAALGTMLIILKKRDFKSEIPFAPFLVTGTFLAMFFGKEIINFYFNLVLIK